MPSPFPGMDPYLEAPHIWPDLHDALATELRNDLNQTLPTPYYARLEMRPELGIIEERIVRQRIVPDVTVVRHPRPVLEPGTGGVAVLAQSRHEVSRFIEYEVLTEPIRHHFIRGFETRAAVTQTHHTDRDRKPLQIKARGPRP